MKQKKINKWLKKELKRAKQLRKYCKKHFPDWRDDEYNCGDLKFLWGLTAGCDAAAAPSFCTNNIAVFYYSRIYKKYYLDIDFSCKNNKEAIKMLDYVYHHFYLYVLNHNLPKKIIKLQTPFELTLTGDSEMEVLSKFKILLDGYCQNVDNLV